MPGPEFKSHFSIDNAMPVMTVNYYLHCLIILIRNFSEASKLQSLCSQHCLRHSKVSLVVLCCTQFCTLGRLSHEVGWKYQNVIQTLEAKRKVKSKRFHTKKRTDEVRAVLCSADVPVQLAPVMLIYLHCLKIVDYTKTTEAYNRKYKELVDRERVMTFGEIQVLLFLFRNCATTPRWPSPRRSPLSRK